MKMSLHRLSLTVLLLISTGVFWQRSSASPLASTTQETYIILYAQQAVPADAAAAIANAGGTLAASYDAIGVAVARSDNSAFRGSLLLDTRIENVSATTRFAVRQDTDDTANAPPVVGIPAPGNDNLSGLQWDMIQIHAPEARAIDGGSRSVLVGDIDSGLDYTHPDLAPNVDFGNSVSCVGGVPDTNPAAWDDDGGHGTHTAGTIAAAKNGVGIVGVAPNVRIAGIKTSNSDGFFFPEAVVCAFMWAGSHHFDVTNNSYFADPWLFNCRNDAEQRAIWKAEQRAIRYAMSQGVVVVSAEGNENQDLSKRNDDNFSPDDGPPLSREVTNACVQIPVEIPGVIGVSANGNKLQKSYYSNYGVGVQVVAPGGDRLFQITSAAPNGRVLSTWPAKFFFPSPLIIRDCSVSPCAVYAYLQGTSMASPHVAGVAALILSQYGRMPQGAVQAIIDRTADAMPCPPNPFLPGGFSFFQATCIGGKGYNGFFGYGQVNALSAIGH